MSVGKAQKLAQKSLLVQREALSELESLVKSIERGQNMINELKAEMEHVNVTHQNRKTTRDDIAYLEDLLRCAKKKLAWENLMEGLQKRIPATLEKVSAVMNDAKNPPTEEVRTGILGFLQQVQTAMEYLEQAKVS
jgi:hypothetical protein